MNSEEFRKYGKDMIDYIIDYRTNIDKRNVAPTFDPGYLKDLIPDEAPFEGENFDRILEDVEEKIMPGVLHWNHPKFFAYFPNGNSYPSMLGDMLSGAISSQGFSWASCPAATELETIVLDWFAKALGLPKAFLSDHPGSRGGGVLQGSASECALVCMIAARAQAIEKLRGGNLDIHESVFLPQLVAYASAEAHSSIEKAAKMALVKLRIIETDSHDRMRVDLLKTQIETDIKNGLTPFFVVATVGTTGSCAFDDLNAIGKVCKNTCSSIWFHVDGAYAGNSFILPEMRKFSEGLRYADSFNTNPNKFLLIAYDAASMWVKNVMLLKAALTVNPLYLQHEHGKAIDYRHYGIPLSRRFRALKLWFVFRSYGISGLQNYIRNHIRLAKKFEELVRHDERFEVMNDVHLGLVCFRLRSSDEMNQELLAVINHTGKSHMIPARVNGKYVIRFCVTYEQATEEQIIEGWEEIQSHADEVIRDHEKSEEEKADAEISKPKRKLNRTKSMRFSFTRSISKEQFDIQGGHLIDGCTPILVIGTTDMDNMFLQATNLNNNNNKLNGSTDVDSSNVEFSNNS